MIPTKPCARALLLLVVLTGSARDGNVARSTAEPVLDPPTLHCLGVYWIVQGDDNKNGRVEVAYRPAAAQAWRRGMDLFRVEKGGNRLENGESMVRVPADAWLFAGSIFGLAPDTEYELRLTLSDPDGGTAEKTLTARTLAEPAAPHDLRVSHVVPGSGGGMGTAADPFRGLQSAQAAARPGCLLLLHHGVYEGTFVVNRSGEVGRPIIWRGAGDGETVIDGQGRAATRPERAIAASEAHDVWFEDLTIRRATWGLVAHMSQRLVVRRCHFHGVKRGITATRNTDGRLGGLFVADNLLEGPFAWTDTPHGARVEENRGIELSGAGNVICYNRVRGFKDGIDMYPSVRCVACDVHNNEVSECLDDGCEMDGSERNCRCFLNRFTNVFQGISVQPVYGGPIYVFRNALYNVEVETFKMHNSPSGALFLHNTSVKKGKPLLLSTSEPVRNSVYRNNLFIGTEGRAYDCDPPMIECDFDYDGFGGSSGPIFLKWNNVRYPSLPEVRAKAPVYRHAVTVDPATVFATGIMPPADPKRQYDPLGVDLRLSSRTAAVDAGTIVPGLNDDFTGKAPDLGAYEVGSRLPHYGPRLQP
ncbi:MAG: hypothetical protein ACLP9L_22780 [Thermoguttaceae bacterium]